jgi:hypothetical protein
MMSATTSQVTNYAVLPDELAISPAYSRISWGAVFAGTAVAVAMSLLLSVLGLAIGVGLFGVSRGVGFWMVFSTLVSMAFGGYVAGRLAGTFSHLDSELHGLTVWALTALLSAFLLARLVSAEISAANRGTGATADIIAGGLPADESGLVRAPSEQGLIERLQQSLDTGGDPALMTRDQMSAEIGLLIRRKLANGSFTPGERDRLTALVAQREGVSHDEASLRVARMEQEANNVTVRDRDALQTASQVVQVGALSVSASLLLGLAAALVGAWFGTRHIRQFAVELPRSTTVSSGASSYLEAH